MPTQAHPQQTPNKKPNTKGKPLGIPIWGWVAAGAIGLILAYVILRKGSGTSSDTSSGSGSSPLGSSDSGSGGGVVASPPPGTTGTNPPATITTEQQTPNPTGDDNGYSPQTVQQMVSTPAATYSVGGVSLPVSGTSAGGNPSGPGPVVDLPGSTPSTTSTPVQSSPTYNPPTGQLGHGVVLEG